MNSRKLLAIIRKELGSYFASPMGYMVLFAYYLVGGFFYWFIVTTSRTASMEPVFQNLIFVLLFISPLVTMRLWSEEEKNGTAELLKTSPLTVWEIVLGKYLGACGFLVVMSLATLVYLMIIMSLGSPDLPPLLANYLGYFLVVMVFFAVGLFASTLSENQIVSAVIAFGLLLLLWVIGVAGDKTSGTLSDFLKYVSVFSHTEDFFKGVIDLSNVVYLSSLIFMFLFLSVKTLESKRS